MDINFFIFFIFFSALSVYLCKKYNLIVDYKIEKHKRFSTKLTSNSIGGILLVTFFIYQFVYIAPDILLLAFLLSILVIGFMSDVKKLNSVALRFVLQTFLIIFFINFLEVRIDVTKISFIDKILENNFYNIFFVSFCLMVLINGANFIDGLNGLLVKYFLLVYLVIFYNFGHYTTINVDFLENLIMILLFILILNLSGFIYMGDSGAYLLSLFTGIYLIDFSAQNFFISPYLVIVFLWYPCFELLFSMIRRYLKRFKAYKPDALHLHQLIYIFLKKKLSITNDLVLHFIISVLINLYNLFTFIVSINFIYSSEILISILAVNIMLYLLFYNFFEKKHKLRNF
tara:strand:+ start:60 stop:1088 length:1029 start_codon:yes stop_codon:yes gene_type:complete